MFNIDPQKHPRVGIQELREWIEKSIHYTIEPASIDSIRVIDVVQHQMGFKPDAAHVKLDKNPTKPAHIGTCWINAFHGQIHVWVQNNKVEDCVEAT